MSVGLWIAALDLTAAAIQRCRGILSIDEHERADRFRTAELTARFISARAALRLVLSRRLACPPAAIEFLYGLHGKPEIGQPASARGLPFNLSHSGEYVAIVIGEEQPVGVDLEILRRLQSPESLARMVFAPQELTCWSELPCEQQTTSLFRVWTLKEACLKATGEGFSRSMTSFAVATDCQTLVALNAATVQFDSDLCLEVQRVAAPTNYALAIAVEGAERPLEVEVQRRRLSELV